MTIGGREAGIRSSPCSATIDADVEAASVSDRINHHRGLGVSPRRKIGGRRRANTDNRTDGNNGKGSILNFSRCPLQHFSTNRSTSRLQFKGARSLGSQSSWHAAAKRERGRLHRLRRQRRPFTSRRRNTFPLTLIPASIRNDRFRRCANEAAGCVHHPHMDDAMWECGGGTPIVAPRCSSATIMAVATG